MRPVSRGLFEEEVHSRLLAQAFDARDQPKSDADGVAVSRTKSITKRRLSLLHWIMRHAAEGDASLDKA